MNILQKSSRVLIATFSPWRDGVRLSINGNLEPMRDFFSKRAAETVIIDQVYPGSDFVIPRIEVYQRGKKQKFHRSSFVVILLTPLLWLFNRSGTHMVFKLRDFLSVVDWGLRDRKRYDLFIGFEAINALAGVLLRCIGRVRRVVYYVSDYSPHRYAVRWFNALYLWLDRQAAMRADVIWDVSATMQPARIDAGLDPQKSAPVIRVPNALYPEQIQHLSMSEIIPYSLVFLGTLGEENGPGLVIEALPFILTRFPAVRLHMVGGPQSEVESLKDIANVFGVANAIVWHGFIADRVKVSTMIRRFAVGLAPYRAIEGSVRWYADATKIRAYLAAGLPVITTSVPPLGKEAASFGAAVMVDDTPQRIAAAVIHIFSDMTLYTTMRERAIAFAKDNTWENEFQKAIKQMKDLME